MMMNEMNDVNSTTTYPETLNTLILWHSMSSIYYFLSHQTLKYIRNNDTNPFHLYEEEREGYFLFFADHINQDPVGHASSLVHQGGWSDQQRV